ncbi:hypothetical protein N9141_00495 [bacterium]|nr:hypothetical protein [bacterium]|tara:strand:+ start:96 stop:287 length:192 start_codon:yes stop_codon:yes gene_type:complete
MTNKNDIQTILHEYLKHCYENQPDHFLIVHEGVEKTVTEWCLHFGGTPELKTNYEFLEEQFDV